MPTLFDQLDDEKIKDIKVLADFVSVYCREKHRESLKAQFDLKNERIRAVLDHKELKLCADCRRLLSHGIAKRLLCPYDPKPACRKCQTHCYAPCYREKMREVMRFSGMYLVRRGRLHLLGHFLK